MLRKRIQELPVSQTMTIDQAAANLREIVGTLGPGDEIVLTRDNKPVAKIVAQPARPALRQPGSCRGMLTIVSEDDDHLEDFKEYM
jgi:antitoxin (DNA-binding transcriptional repressor) of toxin-antitoxin stability system